LRLLQAVRFRYHDIRQHDVRVLHDTQGLLALDPLGGIAGCRGGNDEALDLVVGLVARPDDGDVADRTVADPALAAVDDPVVAVALRHRAQALGRVRSGQRLGQAEGTEQLAGGEPRQPFGALLVTPGDRDGAHDEAVLHADQRRHAGIDPGELEGHPTAEGRRLRYL